jgi:oligoribonuclease NrnB/cAMP/cGMP phosphodiesterase (DHH superfamily)
MERTVVLYHGNCPDGFGGAYAAWKKFGDAAEYVPLGRGDEAPIELVRGADTYLVDFTFNGRDEMARLAEAANRLVALDHHEGVQEITESVPEHVFDSNRSGASIAWAYFHPDTPMPELLSYIEDDDLFRFALPQTRGVLAYLGVHPFTFASWDETASLLADPASRGKLLEKTAAYAEYFELLANLAVERAKLVEFEGYQCYFATAHPYKPMKSLVGNLLARKHPPIALVVTAHPNGYGVSIRSGGGVDVSAIARKYGGNGHTLSSGFLIPREGPFPWTLLEEDGLDG